MVDVLGVRVEGDHGVGRADTEGSAGHVLRVGLGEEVGVRELGALAEGKGDDAVETFEHAGELGWIENVGGGDGLGVGFGGGDLVGEETDVEGKERCQASKAGLRGSRKRPDHILVGWELVIGVVLF